MAKAIEGVLSAAALEAARAAYLAAVGALAEQLRPGFESGELHAMTDGEAEDYELKRPTGEERIDEASVEAFGLHRIAHEEAMTLLAVSPHAECMTGYGFRTARDWLTSAITWDVIATARERGYYTPLAGECADPIASPSCVHCGHLQGAHEADGGCFCNCRGLRLAASYQGAEVQP